METTAYCDDLGRRGVQYLARLTQLRALNLTGHAGLTSGKMAVLSRLVHLEELSLEGQSYLQC